MRSFEDASAALLEFASAVHAMLDGLRSHGKIRTFFCTFTCVILTIIAAVLCPRTADHVVVPASALTCSELLCLITEAVTVEHNWVPTEFLSDARIKCTLK